MTESHVVIIGGGLAGLAAGCYARANGFRTTIVEHHPALGGVCTAWKRGAYTIDGCIHWLTGGPFQQIYEELDIVPRVPLRTIERFLNYRDAHDHFELTISRDLEATAQVLRQVAPGDVNEIQRIVQGARLVAKLDPGIDQPHELATLRGQLSRLWHMRGELQTLAYFRKPFGIWSNEHLKSERLRRILSGLVPNDAPALLLLMILGYLKQGYLSRPEGGSSRFRDALIDTYRARGGQTVLQATVDEVLIASERACGVRLADGTILDADLVISTPSAPETVFRLLGGRYGAPELRERLERWKLFDPIVLASYGVAMPLANLPPTSFIDHIEPLSVGGVNNEHLYVRVYNDDSSFAPPGHAVVQTILTTSYDHWAKAGPRYDDEKAALAARTLDLLDVHLPGVKAAARCSDLATPLTFWNMARSWRGAYEGWTPTPEALFSHVDKTLPGLAGFFMAGQWVEPGGGVPTALMSGRQVVQLICAEDGRPFSADFRAATAAPAKVAAQGASSTPRFNDSSLRLT